MKRMEPVKIGMPEVWPVVLKLIDDAARAGFVLY